MRIEFTLDGPLYAFRSSPTGYKRKSDGKRKGGAFDPDYKNFQRDVLFEAMKRGWKGKVVSLPLWIVRLSVVAHWCAEARLDWSNLYKGVEDALFTQDRFVRPGNKSDFVQFDGPERADIIIEVEDSPK